MNVPGGKFDFGTFNIINTKYGIGIMKLMIETHV